MILVRADGIQYPPLTFPVFSQVISFMQCLETHLAPKEFLDPRTGDVDWGDGCELFMTFSLIIHFWISTFNISQLALTVRGESESKRPLC